ncbi:YibE/F family protein [Cellulomonas cellasea]|uniref:Putative membrane protein n=1 Tax=Cellulomonas cellasea TaxID=43670 RepID=A0A7W4YAH6_9CELL|nr:YibE/F family protein [Cellulomonas cellasea]MBB2921431.1 putative membrane protein [Cellulomonas cellasea]
MPDSPAAPGRASEAPAPAAARPAGPVDHPRRTAATRTRLLLTAVLVPLGLAALLGMALTWPGEPQPTTGELVDVEVQYPTARVTGTSVESCEGTSEDRLADGTVPEQVECLRVFATVTSGSEEGRDIDLWATATLQPEDVRDGAAIVVQRYPATATDGELWAWHDFERTVPLGTLALVFAVVTVLVAGMRGLRALIGLVLAFAVIGTYILPGLVAGEDALLIGLCGSTVIMIAVLYLAHGFSERTSTALLGTLAGLGLTAGLGVLGARAAHLSGVTSEDSYRLAGLLGDQGATALRGLFLCGVVLAGLGVLNDVTITQASAVWELRATSPDADRAELFSHAMRIGRDHIASTVYTIAFAYTGAALPVLLLLEIYGLPLGQTLTSGAFAEEIVRTLVGSIALVLAIPLTTALAVLVVTASPPPRHAQEGHRAHPHVHAH